MIWEDEGPLANNTAFSGLHKWQSLLLDPQKKDRLRLDL